MKDNFWKVFSILALLTFLGSTFIHALSTRYTVQSKEYILDRWTGTVYPIRVEMYKYRR